MESKDDCIRYNKYAVVEFEDGIQSVPMDWLVKHHKLCYPTHVPSMPKIYKMVKNLILVDTNWPLCKYINILGSSNDYNRIKEKEIDAVKYNLSEVDTEAESIIKNQRKIRAKKNLFLEDEEDFQFLKKSSKNIEVTSRKAKLSAKKIPSLPKPPKSLTQQQIRKGNHTCAHHLPSSEPIKSLNEKTLKMCNNNNANKCVASIFNNSEQSKSFNDVFFSSVNDYTPIKKTDKQINILNKSSTKSTNSIDLFNSSKLDATTPEKR